MSATDELRRLLDERGVEWWQSVNMLGCVFTRWYSPLFSDEVVAMENGDGELELFSHLMTPEQAIAATLGAETCHYEPVYTGFTWWDENDVEHYEEYSASDECGSASCDKCGYEMMVGDDGWFDGWDEITEWTEEDGSEHKGYVLKPRFNFCPNCGAKVIG